MLWKSLVSCSLLVCLTKLTQGAPVEARGPAVMMKTGCMHACERITPSEKKEKRKKSCWVYPLFNRPIVTSVHCWLNYNRALTEARWIWTLVPVAAHHAWREVPGIELSLFTFHKKPWLWFFLQYYTDSQANKALSSIQAAWSYHLLNIKQCQNDVIYHTFWNLQRTSATLFFFNCKHTHLAVEAKTL